MQTGDHSETGRSTGPTGGLTHDDVARLLEILDNSSFDYLEVEVDGTRLVAGKSGWQAAPLPMGTSAATPDPAPAASVTAAPAPAPTATAATAPATPAVPAISPDSPVEGGALVTVTAPIVGVFYRAPKPGADPYVEIGSAVEVDQTLGLIEVMKMFNGVTAAQAGEVVELLVGDGEFVEFGQPLMTLRPVAR